MTTWRSGRLVLLIISLIPLISESATIAIGTSYEEVIEILGEPDGELSAGSKSILAYGNGKVTLRNKKVTSVSSKMGRLLEERAMAQQALGEKRDAGLVNHRGKWITPDEQKAIRQQENSKRMVGDTDPAAAGVWMTDFAKASAIAKDQNKKMLLNFTGSDWCGWCIRLDKEVFSKTEFMNDARKNYVLVKLDFPKHKQLSTALKRQNEALARKFNVRGFPSIIVLKSSGKVHKTGGYVQGGPKAFLKSIR